MAKTKEIKEQLNLKKEVSLLPGYILCVIWLIFTIVLVGWVVMASFSTTSEILGGRLFQFETGF
ncbi:MAG: carbohydrate ABC transporter permease, partial [Ruthenibacterium sp.]